MSAPTGPAEPPQTGVPHLDEALRALVDLDDVPVSEHADRLTRVQAALSEALADPAPGDEVGDGRNQPARP